MPAPRADIHVPRYTLLAALIAATLVALALACGSASAADAGPHCATGGSASSSSRSRAPKGAFAGKPADAERPPRRRDGHDLDHGQARQGRLAADRHRRGRRIRRLQLHAGRRPSPVATTSASPRPASPPLPTRRRRARSPSTAARRPPGTAPASTAARTACGSKLTTRTLGVAHKTLPCGTTVEFFLRGKQHHASGDRPRTVRQRRNLGSDARGDEAPGKFSSTEVLGALPL